MTTSPEVLHRSLTSSLAYAMLVRQSDEEFTPSIGLFRDATTIASIAAPFLGDEHKRQVLTLLGDLTRALGADAVGLVADAYWALTPTHDPLSPPPRAKYSSP